MKVCNICKTLVNDSEYYCPKCSSTAFSEIQTKTCVFCGKELAIETIVCPNCHRILPPVQSDQVAQGRYFTPNTVVYQGDQRNYTAPTFPTPNVAVNPVDNPIVNENQNIGRVNEDNNRMGIFQQINDKPMADLQKDFGNIQREVESDTDKKNVTYIYNQFNSKGEQQVAVKPQEEVLETEKVVERKVKPMKAVEPKKPMHFPALIVLTLVISALVLGILLPYLRFTTSSMSGMQLIATQMPDFIWEMFPSKYFDYIYAGALTGVDLALFKIMPFVHIGAVVFALATIIASLCSFSYTKSKRSVLIAFTFLTMLSAITSLVFIMIVFNFATAGLGLLLMTAFAIGTFGVACGLYRVKGQ